MRYSNTEYTDTLEWLEGAPWSILIIFLVHRMLVEYHFWWKTIWIYSGYFKLPHVGALSPPGLALKKVQVQCRVVLSGFQLAHRQLFLWWQVQQTGWFPRFQCPPFWSHPQLQVHLRRGVQKTYFPHSWGRVILFCSPLKGTQRTRVGWGFHATLQENWEVPCVTCQYGSSNHF